MLQVLALRMAQGPRVLYMARMDARDILDVAITAEWDPDLGWDLDKQGYQRAPVPDHYKSIGNFLANDSSPFMPTSALLCAREGEYGRLPFEVKLQDGATAVGYLTIPDGRNLFIVDYQHRWSGLRYAIEQLSSAHLNTFTVPAIIMADVPRQEEIKQFYLINSKQKRVDTDLALALLQTMASAASEAELKNLVGPGKHYRIRATRLTFGIASVPSGPWTGRIKQPHDLPQKQAVLSPKSFADSLAPIVSSRSPVSYKNDDELVAILLNYWSAIQNLMPVAFANPHQSSIQRTHGVFAMHMVAAKRVFRNCRLLSDFSEQAMSTQLTRARAHYLREDFWATNGPVKIYAGSGGHRELARLIMETIPDYPITLPMSG